MNRSGTLLKFLFTLVVVTSPLMGQFNRTAVSVNGNDANTCAVADPCRNFAAAYWQTNPGGEMIVLDSGGFGTLGIGKSISVVAPPGVYAGIRVTSGWGIFVNAGSSANVVIRGLTIYAPGGPTDFAVQVNSAGTVSIENLVANGGGVEQISVGTLLVSDSVIRNSSNGIFLNGGPGQTAFIERVAVAAVQGHGFGLHGGGVMTVRDSTVNGGLNGFSAFSTGSGSTINVENCVATNLFRGAIATEGMIRLSKSIITGNSYGVFLNPGGVVESFQNNKIRGNTTSDGTASLTLVSQN